MSLKKKVFSDLDRFADDDVILASSTSCIVPSLFTADLRHRAQCIVAHPVRQGGREERREGGRREMRMRKEREGGGGREERRRKREGGEEGISEGKKGEEGKQADIMVE